MVKKKNSNYDKKFYCKVMKEGNLQVYDVFVRKWSMWDITEIQVEMNIQLT